MQTSIDRIDVLEKVHAAVYESILKKQAETIQLVGNPGTGKTTVLKQVERFLIDAGLFPQILNFEGKQNFSLLRSLPSFADSVQENEIKDTSRETVITNTRELLLKMRDLRRDVLIIMIDDAHLLEKSTIQNLSDIFRSEFTDERMVLILSGRKGWEDETAIEIGKFSEDEMSRYFETNFYDNWKNDYPDIFQWICDFAQNHPFRLSLFIEHCLEKGYLSRYFCVPLDVLQQVELPQSLIDLIKFRYSLKRLSETEKSIIHYLSCSPKELSGKELSKLIKNQLKQIDEAIKNLHENRWLLKTSNRPKRFVLFHPLIQEMVLSYISSDEKERLHKKFIENEIPQTLSEKAFHILNVSGLVKSEKSLLKKYCEELERDGQFYSAIQVYEKIDPDMNNRKIAYCIGKNYSRINRFQETTKYFLFASEPNNTEFSAYCKVQLGTMFFRSNEWEKAEKYFLEALENQNRSTDDTIAAVSQMAVLKYYGGHEKLGKKYFDQLAQIAKAGENRIKYLNVATHLNERFFLGMNQEQLISEGLELAKQNGDNYYISLFEVKFQLLYSRDFKYEQALKHGENAYKHARKISNPLLQYNVMRANAGIYGNLGKTKETIQTYKRLISLSKRLNIAEDTLKFSSRLADTYISIGHIPLIKQSTVETKEHFTGQLHIDIGSKRRIGIFEIDFGDRNIGMKMLENIFEESKTNQLQEQEIFTGAFLSVLKDESGEYFQRAVEYFLKNNLREELLILYRFRGWRFIENREYENLRQLIVRMTEISEEVDKSISFRCFQIALLIGEKSVSRAGMRLLKNEALFNGHGMLEYTRFYHWISKQKTVSKEIRKRSRFLAQTLHAICHCDMKSKPEKHHWYLKGFPKLLNTWREAMQNKTVFPQLVLDGFADDAGRKQIITESLGLWDIQIGEEDALVPCTEDSVIQFCLLGEPEIHFGGQIITRKQWKSKKAFDVLIYLIAKCWNSKTLIPKEKILDIFWNPMPENREKAQVTMRKTISMLRQQLDSFCKDIILQSDREMGINWENPNLRFDVDQFWDSSGKGLKEHKKKEHESALVHLQFASHLYRDDFACSLDFRWLDPIRATFYNRLKEVEEALTFYIDY